jgi:hypothetical protein
LSFIELNIRLFPARAEHPDLPDGESRARVVYEVYPDAVSDALTALQEFGFVLSDPSVRSRPIPSSALLIFQS